jgi:hypothetical protein
MCYGSVVRTSSLRMRNYTNNIRIRIRNRQSVQVADNSIAKQKVEEQYARGPKSANPDLYQCRSWS